MPHTMRVLVVEDQPELQAGLARILGGEGYSVVLAESVHRAMERLQETAPYDLVILDLGLPDGRGDALLPTIHSQLPRPIVIVLSGEVDSATIVRLRKQCDEILPKPYTRETVITVIKQLMDERLERTGSTEAKVAQFAAEMGLTVIESDVVRLFAAGDGDDAVARKLELKPAAVASLWARIYRKTGCDTPQAFMKLLHDHTASLRP